MKTKIEAAKQAGREAFEAGKVAVPSLDGNLTQLCDGLKVGQGLTVIKAWLTGWHTANINAAWESGTFKTSV